MAKFSDQVQVTRYANPERAFTLDVRADQCIDQLIDARGTFTLWGDGSDYWIIRVASDVSGMAFRSPLFYARDRAMQAWQAIQNSEAY